MMKLVSNWMLLGGVLGLSPWKSLEGISLFRTFCLLFFDNREDNNKASINNGKRMRMAKEWDGIREHDISSSTVVCEAKLLEK